MNKLVAFKRFPNNTYDPFIHHMARNKPMIASRDNWKPLKPVKTIAFIIN